MATYLRHPATVVWLILAAATGVSWWFGAVHGLAIGKPDAGTGAMILALAFIKTYLILQHFMEVRHAPLPLKIVSGSWVVLVGGIVVGLYLLAGRG